MKLIKERYRKVIMEENEVQQENPKDNSLEARKAKQISLIETAPLGTYWKQVWHDKTKNDTKIDDYFHITKMEYHSTGPVLGGERLKINEECLFDLDYRASLYDFSFDKNHGGYYAEQISKEEYEGVKNKVIQIYKNKSDELRKRGALFYKFNSDNKKLHCDYNEMMKIVEQRYDSIKEYLDDGKSLIKLCEERGQEDLKKEAEEKLAKLKKDNRLLFYSESNKVEWPNFNRSFSIAEIDVSSLSFEPEKINEQGIGYVGGSPFENNGKNFTFKVRFYGQSLFVDNYNSDFYETKVRVSFDNGNKNWRWEDPEGWRTYIATNDKFTNGEYKNSPSWSGNEFFILDDWHFEQLLDLINYTGLEENVNT